MLIFEHYWHYEKSLKRLQFCTRENGVLFLNLCYELEMGNIFKTIDGNNYFNKIIWKVAY